MVTRCCAVVVVIGLALVGCRGPGLAAQVEPAEAVVVVVTAAYRGANAQTVAEVVAAPIEQQVKGVEGLVRIESESRRHTYTARLRFGPKTDPKLAVQTVQERVARAAPTLPDEVRQAGVTVKAGAAEGDPKQAAIALTDRGDHGREALQKWAGAVVKRLAADGAAVKPEAFPGPDETVVAVRIDQDKCARRGVAPAAVGEALKAAGFATKFDAVKKLTVTSAKGDKVALEEVATITEVTGPAAVYRVDLHPAVRVTGPPPEGKTPAAAAARWAEVAEAERPKGFAVVNLTAK